MSDCPAAALQVESDLRMNERNLRLYEKEGFLHAKCGINTCELFPAENAKIRFQHKVPLTPTLLNPRKVSFRTIRGRLFFGIFLLAKQKKDTRQRRKLLKPSQRQAK
jgi:hypothetical protein